MKKRLPGTNDLLKKLKSLGLEIDLVFDSSYGYGMYQTLIMAWQTSPTIYDMNTYEQTKSDLLHGRRYTFTRLKERITSFSQGTVNGSFYFLDKHETPESLAGLYDNFAKIESHLSGVSKKIQGLKGRNFSEVGISDFPKEEDLPHRFSALNSKNPTIESFYGIDTSFPTLLEKIKIGEIVSAKKMNWLRKDYPEHEIDESPRIEPFEHEVKIRIVLNDIKPSDKKDWSNYNLGLSLIDPIFRKMVRGLK